MDSNVKRQLIVETGKMLLEHGLVARTWGNVSARAEDTNLLISPSGLDYMTTTEEDIALFNWKTGKWTGPCKPSGEKGVHAAVYKIHPHINFVIHTHQTYGTAIGLAGYEDMDITDDELRDIGGYAVSEYAMNGTKKLISAVADGLESGAETIFMPHHGVLICGRDRDEAMRRALLIEDICRRNCFNQLAPELTETAKAEGQLVLEDARGAIEFVELANSPEAVKLANMAKPMKAQIEDMAQMVGHNVPVVLDTYMIIQALKKNGVIMVPGIGFLVTASSPGDAEALRLLMDKAAKVKLHTLGANVKGELGRVDCIIERRNYLNKYSKQMR